MSKADVARGKIRTFPRFSILAWFRFHTKRTPDTSYRFLDFEPLLDTLTSLHTKSRSYKTHRNPIRWPRNDSSCWTAARCSPERP